MTVQVVNKVVVKPHVWIECPHCKEQMDVNWYVELVLSDRRKAENTPPKFEQTCRNCDASYSFYAHSHTDIDYTQIPTKEFRGLMLVKRPEQELYMVVEQAFYVRDDKVQSDNEYWINQHTCPTNWFKVLMVAESGNPDPHGVFVWVRSLTFVEIEQKFGYKRDMLRGEDDDCNAQNEAFLHIFPEIETGGIIIEDEAERMAGQQMLIEQGKL